MKTKEKEEKFDEIVFSGRNTEYGAYQIRKEYSGNVTKALMITVTLFLLGIAVPLIASYYNRNNPIGPIIDDGPVLMNPDDLKNDEIKPPPDLPDEMTEKQVRNLAPVVVAPEDIDTSETWSMEPVFTNPPIDTTFRVEGSTEKPVVLDPVIETPVHLIVEEMPEYIGGEEARLQYLRDNIHYPQLAKEADVQGTVYITFIIDEGGNLTHLEVARGIGAGCDEEALRVLKSMPKWNPGKQDGKPVRVKYAMPVLFKLL